ncbi:MAG: P-type conjugative transfer protein VirB9 [Methylococcales bacterium]|jgi:type IV secretion system protein VirB9|nr:P-type conjugative transfer protein VirB9 [Methylococcales bacterium]
MKKLLLSAMICAFLSPSVSALDIPSEGRRDARVKTIAYSKHDVVKIVGHFGRSSHVTFADDEIIKFIDIGDSLAWEITPAQNHLILKPREDEADTNLTVLTNKRAYHFELRAKDAKNITDKSQTFALMFEYPAEKLAKQLAMQAALEKIETDSNKSKVLPSSKAIAPGDWNWNYTKKGDDEISPRQVFDDGEFTYFQFNPQAEAPAIFLVDRDGNESLLNYHVETGQGRGHFLVVQRTGKQFVLRSGEYVTCIFNENKFRGNNSLLPKEGAYQSSLMPNNSRHNFASNENTSSFGTF